MLMRTKNVNLFGLLHPGASISLHIIAIVIGSSRNMYHWNLCRQQPQL